MVINILGFCWFGELKVRKYKAHLESHKTKYLHCYVNMS